MGEKLEMKVVAISGGFDPVHIGHVRMMRDAKALGDRLVVIVNNDNWLKKKKGFVFMPEAERKEIIEAIKWVDEVVLTSHEPDTTDMSVCKELSSVVWPLHVFANGGDRKADNIPEYVLCEQIGIEMVFGIGGDKIQSSSDLVKASQNVAH